MSFNRSSWAHQLSLSSQSSITISPSSITLNEPVVAEGEVVFAANEDGYVDIVMAAYSVLDLTVILE